jgi:hypothetical protein
VYSSPLKRCFQSGILVLLSYNYCNKSYIDKKVKDNTFHQGASALNW